MFRSFPKMLRRKAPEENPAASDPLAMTDELRDALFPKTAQMVSAIFERPLPPLTRPPAPPPSSAEGSFLVV